jgi:hypothetical protein
MTISGEGEIALVFDSSDDLVRHLAGDVGQAKVTARVTVSPLLMVEAQEMECRPSDSRARANLGGFGTEAT